ncbi:unnamed protein product [Sphagnum troendelagicum]
MTAAMASTMTLGRTAGQLTENRTNRGLTAMAALPLGMLQQLATLLLLLLRDAEARLLRDAKVLVLRDAEALLLRGCCATLRRCCCVTLRR